ncbi:hypothetical protein HAX54_003510 [Datura stramonium]|uniref:Nodulin-like domain-containing protein n=1 Tax=Datura stramonium TaxID=4076 RepID=A0ABS8RTP3_DATST|nr:hypothetical protein [Datura stramonium]
MHTQNRNPRIGRENGASFKETQEVFLKRSMASFCGFDVGSVPVLELAICLGAYPVIKSGMGYNQRQIALLGVAKDLGDSIGFLAGILCEVLPISQAVLFIGVVQNFCWLWSCLADCCSEIAFLASLGALCF